MFWRILNSVVLDILTVLAQATGHAAGMVWPRAAAAALGVWVEGSSACAHGHSQNQDCCRPMWLGMRQHPGEPLRCAEVVQSLRHIRSAALERRWVQS